MAVFKLHEEDEQIICTVITVCHNGQIVWEKSSFQKDKYQTICLLSQKFVCPICISDDLFVWVDLSVQTICSPESICPSRRFVHPLERKRPLLFKVMWQWLCSHKFKMASFVNENVAIWCVLNAKKCSSQLEWSSKVYHSKVKCPLIWL